MLAGQAVLAGLAVLARQAVQAVQQQAASSRPADRRLPDVSVTAAA